MLDVYHKILLLANQTQLQMTLVRDKSRRLLRWQDFY